MSKRLGISVYPEHFSEAECINYIDKAKGFGFERIFMNLLEVGEESEAILSKFKRICTHAKNIGFEVILDVNPAVFKELKIASTDIGFFKEIGATGIRLDEDFGGKVEAKISNNKLDMKLEINASTFTNIMDRIIENKGNPSNIIACHNFYPQKYTGLSFELFANASRKLHEQKCLVAAFVSSLNPNAQGPWPLKEGLPTIEMHRDVPLEWQARHFIATNLVDDIIISNQPAFDKELEALAQLHKNGINFKIDLDSSVTSLEREIIFDFKESKDSLTGHKIRGDYSDYMIRSTMPRVIYKNESIMPRKYKNDTFERGDVVVLNDKYGRYKGELHIVTKTLPNEGKKNFVGRLLDDDLIFLDYISPWKEFKFIK